MSASAFTRTANCLKNSELSDSRSSTTSSASRRLVRKQDDRPASRKSLSRSNSRKSSCEGDLGSFFVKMRFEKETSYDKLATRRSLHMGSEGAINPEKKREPTPVPGYVRRKRGEVE